MFHGELEHSRGHYKVSGGVAILKWGVNIAKRGRSIGGEDKSQQGYIY